MNYLVRVQNTHGVLSSVESCTSHAVAVGEPADLTSFLALTIALVVLGLLLFLVAALYILHRRYPDAFARRLRRARSLVVSVLHSSAHLAAAPWRRSRRDGSGGSSKSSKDSAQHAECPSPFELSLDMLECAGSEPSFGPPRLARKKFRLLPRALLRPDLELRDEVDKAFSYEPEVERAIDTIAARVSVPAAVVDESSSSPKGNSSSDDDCDTNISHVDVLVSPVPAAPAAASSKQAGAARRGAKQTA